MAIMLDVAKADLAFEAGYAQPEFGLFEDRSAILALLFKRLEPHGLRLTDLRFEQGNHNPGEQHIICYLFNFLMTVKIRLERIEVNCSELPREYTDKFKAAIIDVLKAVKEHRPNLLFRGFALAVGMHAKLKGLSPQDYLSRFVATVPQNLGPSTGNGVVFYFGPEGDRLLSSITVDMSAGIQDAVFLRVHGTWDATKVSADVISRIGDAFLHQALESIELSLPG